MEEGGFRVTRVPGLRPGERTITRLGRRTVWVPSGRGACGRETDDVMAIADIQPQPQTQTFFDDHFRDEEPKYDFKGTAFKMFEAAATTFASLSILGYVVRRDLNGIPNKPPDSPDTPTTNTTSTLPSSR